jgi:hypothetical protein
VIALLLKSSGTRSTEQFRVSDVTDSGQFRGVFRVVYEGYDPSHTSFMHDVDRVLCLNGKYRLLQKSDLSDSRGGACNEEWGEATPSWRVRQSCMVWLVRVVSCQHWSKGLDEIRLTCSRGEVAVLAW